MSRLNFKTSCRKNLIIIINSVFTPSIVLDRIPDPIIAIFGLWRLRPYKGEPGNEGANPQATGNSVEQGAGTQQIYALSVQNLSVSINDLNPRRGLASLNR